MIRDGNCLFHALLAGEKLGGGEGLNPLRSQESIRTEVLSVLNLVQNPEIKQRCTDVVKNCSSEGSYQDGDELIFLAYCYSTNRKLVVYVQDQEQIYEYNPVLAAQNFGLAPKHTGEINGTIFILNSIRPQLHFDLLYPPEALSTSIYGEINIIILYISIFLCYFLFLFVEVVITLLITRHKEIGLPGSK